LKLNLEAAQSEIKFGNAVELERIYPLDRFQGKGIGRFLVEFSIQFAKDKATACLWLGVWNQNFKAIKFYKTHGFIVVSSHDFIWGMKGRLIC